MTNYTFRTMNSGAASAQASVRFNDPTGTEDMYTLARVMLSSSVAVLCQNDVKNEWLSGLETWESKSDERKGAIGISYRNGKALDKLLALHGAVPLNVVPSAHQAELDWLNDHDCSLRFSAIADVLGESPEDLRRFVVRNMLDKRAPKNVRFTLNGPLSLVGREQVSA